MKVLFIKQQNTVLFFNLFYPQKENKYTKITTTTKKQNKLKVLCFFHSTPRNLLILKHNLSAIPGTSHDKQTCMYEISHLKNLEKMEQLKLQCSL